MGFLELRRQCGVSPEARRGSQGASRAAPGKSGLHARGEGQRVMALESREGTRASRRVEEGLSCLSLGAAGNPRFPRLLPGTLGNFPGSSFPAWPGEQSRVLSPNGRGGWTPLRLLRGLQETASRLERRAESWLPLEMRPDFPGEPGMQPRDPCLPWRGKLGPGHTTR